MAFKTLRLSLVLLVIWTIGCLTQPKGPPYTVFDLEQLLQTDEGFITLAEDPA